MNEIEIVENALKETLRIISESFGPEYAAKNPELVRFLIEKVQQEKDRSFNRELNNLSRA